MNERITNTSAALLHYKEGHEEGDPNRETYLTGHSLSEFHHTLYRGSHEHCKALPHAYLLLFQGVYCRRRHLWVTAYFGRVLVR